MLPLAASLAAILIAVASGVSIEFAAAGAALLVASAAWLAPPGSAGRGGSARRPGERPTTTF